MKRFKNILVHCGADSGLDTVIARAVWLAGANQARVTLLHVVDSGSSGLSFFSALGGSEADVADSIIGEHRRKLEGIAAKMRETGIEVDVVVRPGAPTIEIIRQVIEHNHDLVMQSAQPQPSWPLLTGLDMHLIRKCPSAVWVIKSTDPAKAMRILAAVDPDPDDATRDGLNHAVMQMATSLAAADGAKLDALYAWTLPEETTLRHGRVTMRPEEVDALVERRRAACARGFDLLIDGYRNEHPAMRPVCVKGEAADLIPEHAASEGVDTIVMGTVGRTGVAGVFIGNTAETILSRVHCSILTVKPAGFVSPIS